MTEPLAFAATLGLVCIVQARREARKMTERAEEVLFQEFAIRRVSLSSERVLTQRLPVPIRTADHTCDHPYSYSPRHATPASREFRDTLTKDELSRLSRRAGTDIDYVRQVFQVHASVDGPCLLRHVCAVLRCARELPSLRSRPGRHAER